MKPILIYVYIDLFAQIMYNKKIFSYNLTFINMNIISKW